MTVSQLSSVVFSEDDVLEALCKLKRKKSDASGISHEHLIYCSSAIAKPLAIFFTTILHHGYMPSKCFRDCVLLPIQKGNKDATLAVKTIDLLLLPPA